MLSKIIVVGQWFFDDLVLFLIYFCCLNLYLEGIFFIFLIGFMQKLLLVCICFSLYFYVFFCIVVVVIVNCQLLIEVINKLIENVIFKKCLIIVVVICLILIFEWLIMSNSVKYVFVIVILKVLLCFVLFIVINIFMIYYWKSQVLNWCLNQGLSVDIVVIWILLFKRWIYYYLLQDYVFQQYLIGIYLVDIVMFNQVFVFLGNKLYNCLLLCFFL